MKHSILLALICASLGSATANAQLVDREKYPDYSSELKPDYSLLENNLNSPVARTKGTNDTALPDHVDNSKTKFFPPVFNQDGGSCGSASRICYMFTHELNAYRNADATDLNNRYPSHFVWLLTFGNSGKEDFVIRVGVPSAKVYGGTTYSSIFGNQDASQFDFGWMQGYDKWYSGMWNRMESTANFPMHVGTEEGRQAVKRWLYNHNGDNYFQCGGIVGIGVASGGDWRRIPTSPTNDEIGVTNMYYVNKWGTQTDHALTVVGYDDRIEFDLNGNGILGEESADEKGAWIVVNSWSAGWCNKGFIYCPYAYAGPMFSKDGTFPGNFWYPEIYKVRKNYRPLRTIKLKMDYSHRSELCLGAGISTNLDATEPEKTISFDHFKYAGDGRNGDSIPAPEIPMLGKWADGMHYEPMEFGYDLTDLSASFDKNMPLKYFFVIETRNSAIGHGKIYNASIIDYEFQKNGIETPFDINGEGVEIQNKGNKTIISTIVYGETYYAPQNLSLVDNLLSWNAPLRSVHELKSYKVFANNEFITEVPANELNFDVAPYLKNTNNFSLLAVYADGTESAKLNVNTPIKATGKVNKVVNFSNAGFSIHNVFNTKYNEATIEYWIEPNSLRDWNQQAGPGWGTFLLHANGNGAISVGWSTSQGNRINTAPGCLSTGVWSHVAITVKHNVLKIYVNGIEKGSTTSNQYSGIGGFGDLNFLSSGNNSQDACYDEIRIWNYARSAEEIKNNYKSEYSGNLIPSGLIAYYKGEVIQDGDKKFIREYIKGNHATIHNVNKANHVPDFSLKFTDPSDGMLLEIVPPTTPIYKAIPAQFAIQHSAAISKLSWSAEGANVKDLQVKNPTFTFNATGKQTITAVGYNKDGESVTKTCTVDVLDAPAPDATFTATTTEIPAGEYVSFNSTKPMMGYLYKWSMPGADEETASNFNASASYQAKGEYTVTLTVTGPDGTSNSSSQKITVKEVAPLADFEITPSDLVKGETTFLRDNSKYNPNKWQWLIKSNTQEFLINGQNTSWTPNEPGFYNVTLTVANASGSNNKYVERAITVYNADSKNGLNFTNSNSTVELSKPLLSEPTEYLTIEWWMNPRDKMTNGLGDEKGLSLKVNEKGALEFGLNGVSVESSENFIKPNEWHHYTVTYKKGLIFFLRDGKSNSRRSFSIKKIPALKNFAIGLPNAPFTGQIDELRIWNSALSNSQIQEYANAPIEDIDKAITEDKLILYYDFNQSGGDVIDRTPNKNNGVRKNFGPDGDAWGLSRGVFSLNFGKMAPNKNVTADYLKNYKCAFKADANKVVNPTVKDRYFAITDWTLENSVVEGDITSGVYVDKQKGNCFAFASNIDGFANLKDHKAYQTIKLPAGSYEFSLNFANYSKQSGTSYIVAAVGKGLPNTEDLDGALAHSMISAYNNEANKIEFLLAKDTEISLGLVINMDATELCTIDQFKLIRKNTIVLDADGADGYTLSLDESEVSSLFLPYPTVIPENLSAYVAKAIEGDMVVLEKLNDGIVPAKTGVIITGEAGEYHFAPSTATVASNSILTGVLEETPADNSKRYFEFDNQKEFGFHHYNASVLEANRAYLVTDGSDTHEFYKVNLTAVGIEEIETETMPNEIYDLTGRRVNNPVKGLYIVNGKKVLVK